MQPKRICTAAVSFLVVISIIFAVLPVAFADNTLISSPLSQPNFTLHWVPDRAGWWQFNFLLSGSQSTYLFQFDIQCNAQPKIYLQSSSGLLRFVYSGSGSFSSAYELHLFDVVTGDLVDTVSYSFSGSSSSYSISPSRIGDYSLSEFYNYYADVFDNSTDLIYLDNVEWATVHYPPLPSVYNSSKWLHFPPSVDWNREARFYAHSSGTSTSWEPNFQLRNFSGLHWAFFETSRSVPDLFTYSSANYYYSILGREKSYAYGQSFNLSTQFYSQYPMDTYCFVGSLDLYVYLAALMEGDYEFNPNVILQTLYELAGGNSSSMSVDIDWFYADYHPAASMLPDSYFGISVDFSIPSDYDGDSFCVLFFQIAVPPRETLSSQSWAISDIYIDPIGESRDIVLSASRDIEFRQDIIGSDVEGQESGLKGIIYYLSHLSDDLMLFFNSLKNNITSNISSMTDSLIGSAEDGVESGLMGILKKIRELPEMLSDKIKSLFVPDENFFDYDPVNEDDPIPMGYKQRFTLLFEEHLGAVYQAPAMVVDFIQELNDFEPVTGLLPQQYDIAFPSKSFFIQVDPPLSHNHFDISEDPFSEDDSEFVLLPDSGDGFYHVDLSFLASDPYSTLYSIYRAVSSFILIVSIISFCIFKFNEILRGMPSDDN